MTSMLKVACIVVVTTFLAVPAVSQAQGPVFGTVNLPVFPSNTSTGNAQLFLGGVPVSNAFIIFTETPSPSVTTRQGTISGFVFPLPPVPGGPGGLGVLIGEWRYDIVSGFGELEAKMLPFGGNNGVAGMQGNFFGTTNAPFFGSWFF